MPRLTLRAASRTEKQDESRPLSRTSISGCSATVQPSPPPALAHNAVKHCDANTCKPNTRTRSYVGSPAISSSQQAPLFTCSLGVAVEMTLVSRSSMLTRGSSSGPFCEEKTRVRWQPCHNKLARSFLQTTSVGQRKKGSRGENGEHSVKARTTRLFLPHL